MPWRRRLAVACVMIRSSAGNALTSESFSALASCLAVRNWVQTMLKSETRFVVRVNCAMNGRKSFSVLLRSAKSLVGHEQQGLGPEHFEVALVEHVVEHIGFGLQLGSQPFNELPVLLGVLALDHHHQIVLRRELLLEPEEVLMVLLVGRPPDCCGSCRIESGVFDRDEDAEDEQRQLRIEEQPPMAKTTPASQARNRAMKLSVLSGLIFMQRDPAPKQCRRASG